MKSSRIQELKDMRQKVSDSMEAGTADPEKAQRIINKINDKIGDGGDVELSDLTLKFYTMEDDEDSSFYKGYGSSNFGMDDEEYYGSGERSGIFTDY